MANYVRKNYTLAAGTDAAAMYWIKVFLDWVVATHPTAIEIIYDDPGGGDWLSEAGPLTGSYIVIKSKYPDADGKYWEACIAYVTLGGLLVPASNLTIPGSGPCIAMCPYGGWDDTDKDWDTNVSTDFQYFKSATGAWSVATQFHAAVVEKMVNGVVDNVALIIWGKMGGGAGVADMGIYSGAMFTFRSDILTPMILLNGIPAWGIAGTNWGSKTTQHGWIPATKSAVAALHHAYIHDVDDGQWKLGESLDDIDSEPCHRPFEVFNQTSGGIRGWLVEVFRTDASKSNTVNGALTQRIETVGLALPWTP